MNIIKSVLSWFEDFGSMVRYTYYSHQTVINVLLTFCLIFQLCMINQFQCPLKSQLNHLSDLKPLLEGQGSLISQSLLSDKYIDNANDQE